MVCLSPVGYGGQLMFRALAFNSLEQTEGLWGTQCLNSWL